MYRTKRKWRTSGGKYMGKKFNIMERRTGFKTSTNSMKWSPVCEKDVADALSTTLNWKAHGRDQIANFCLSNLQQHTSI